MIYGRPERPPSGQIFDADTAALLNSAGTLAMQATHENAATIREALLYIEDAVRNRMEIIAAGVMQAPPWFQAELKRIDPCLRARWDCWEYCWVIERYAKPLHQYLLVLRCRDDENQPVALTDALLAELKEGDTWRFSSPGKYLAFKREKAARQRLRNELMGQDRLRDKVDRMSRKQIREFIDVERAIRTGEKIVAHGPMEKFLEDAHENTRKAEAAGQRLDDPRMAINPGMNPLIYERDSRIRRA